MSASVHYIEPAYSPFVTRVFAVVDEDALREPDLGYRAVLLNTQLVVWETKRKRLREWHANENKTRPNPVADGVSLWEVDAILRGLNARVRRLGASLRGGITAALVAFPGAANAAEMVASREGVAITAAFAALAGAVAGGLLVALMTYLERKAPDDDDDFPHGM